MPLRDQDRARPREQRTREGRTFVSGLPGADLADRSAPASALDAIAEIARAGSWLMAIRARALKDAALVAPRAVRRFDGAEHIPADPADAAAHAIYLAVAALMDAIETDRALAIRFGAILARRGDPPPAADI